MKILHVINSLGLGGAERLISDLVPMFNKHYKCDVLLLRETDLIGTKEKTLIDILEDKNIKVSILSKKSLYKFNFLFKIRDIIKDYDLVHSHLFPSQYWLVFSSMILARNKRPILITTEHNTYNRRRKIPFFKVLDRFVYNRYDKIISISQMTDDALIQYSKLSEDKTIIIENGVNLSIFKKASPNKDILKNYHLHDKYLLVQVAGFRDQKDQDTLIRALPLLPDKMVAVFAGVGKRIEQCKNLATQLGVSARCVFLGKVKNVESLLKLSDLVIISSHWEGFGLVAIEGMASGIPIIASNVPGLSQVVSGAGLLFTKSSTQELVNKILELYNDDDFYSRVSTACIKRAEEYSIDNMANQYLNLYNTFLNNESN